MHDVLDGLFADRQPLDEKQLFEIAEKYIRLYSDTAEVVTTSEWDNLNLQGKILTFMIGKKVLRIKGIINIEDEKMTSNQLEGETGLKGNSIRPTLSRLVDMRLLRYDKESGSYMVPDYAVSHIHHLIVQNRGDNNNGK